MGLKYKFKKADKILQSLGEEDRDILNRICHEIEEAEIALRRSSRDVFLKCYDNCEGLCCRNVDINNIIGQVDCVYVVAMEGNMNGRIDKCLENERPFFSADCVFLENGEGPCMFPPNSRPEVCITSFCNGESAMKKEIRNVKLKFFKLSLFLTAVKSRFLKKVFFHVFS